MNWYELGNGPLRALKVLLDSPLDFDPVEYIDRTFDGSDNVVDKNTLKLAYFYNDVRKGLFSKVSSVPLLLTNCAKLTPNNYNKTTAPLIHELPNNPIPSEAIIGSLLVKSCDAVNIQLDRLLESFKVEDCSGKHLNSDLSEFISFYFLSEVLFFALVGMASVEFDDNLIKIKPASKETVNQLHRKWFANHWEQSSSIANIAYFDALPKGADKDVMFKEAMLLFGQGLRDKIFSIPASELPNKLNHLESIKWISKICNLTALCMWCQIKNEMKFAPYSLLEKVGVERSDIDTLMKLIEKYPQPDRVFSVNAKGVSLDNPNITNQLRVILNDMANAISEKKLNQLIGDYFEKEYIAKYFLRDELSNNYKVHSGILAHEVKDESLKPDVDFILEDLRRNIFFFIQVKYLRIGGKAYISGDLDHIVSGKLSKGVKQLADAKVAMESGKLKEVLAKMSLNNCNQENSAFLLIHNICNFDFCIWPSGIVSYEWNSIRNLFKDGEITFGHSKSAPNSWRHTQALPIDKPDELINFFMKQGPASNLGRASTLFETDKVAVKVRIDDKQLICQGMGL